MKNGLFVDSNGSQSYYKDDLLHRADGPAFVGADGSQAWYLNGFLHRSDGPAYIPACIDKFEIQEWWLNGVFYSFEDYFYKLFPEDSPERTLFLLKWSGS